MLEAKDFRVRDLVGKIRKELTHIEQLEQCKRVPSIAERLKHKKEEMLGDLQLLNYFNEHAIRICFKTTELVEIIRILPLDLKSNGFPNPYNFSLDEL